MAKMFKVSPPENSGELLVLEHLEAHLPDSFIVLGGVTAPDRNGAAQIDAVVLGPYAISAVEVKDWRGKLTGHFNGPWQANDRRMPNPCAQARRCSAILRSYIRQHATGILTDSRVFFAIDVYAMVVLVDPNADTTCVEIEESKYFALCKNREDLVITLQKPPAESKRFLTTEENHRLAELLGVPKSTLDDWKQPKTGLYPVEASPSSAPYASPPSQVDAVPPSDIPAPVTPQSIACSHCGASNRTGAKHCRSCGAKF